MSTVEGGCRDCSMKTKDGVPVLSFMGTMSPLLGRAVSSLKWGDLLPKQSL